MKFKRTPHKYFYSKKYQKIVLFKRGKEPGRTYFIGLTNETTSGIPRKLWTFFDMVDFKFIEITKAEAKQFIPEIH